MKCAICKNNYPDIHKIQGGNEIRYMCAKAYNNMLAHLDNPVLLMPDLCPKEQADELLNL